MKQHYLGQTIFLIKEDWNRLKNLGASKKEFKISVLIHPRFVHIVLIRVSHYLYANKRTILAKLISVLNYFLFKIEVSAKTKIGPGLVIPHPDGIVIGARSIGSNVTIFQQVTIGSKYIDFELNELLRPTIGNNAILGAGSKILGNINIGQGAVIGANAVVIKDVPAFFCARGVPARVFKQK